MPTYAPPDRRRPRLPLVLAAVVGLLAAAAAGVYLWNQFSDRAAARTEMNERDEWPSLLKERRKQSDLGYYEDGRDRPGEAAAKAREEGMKLEARIRDIKKRHPDLQWGN